MVSYSCSCSLARLRSLILNLFASQTAVSSARSSWPRQVAAMNEELGLELRTEKLPASIWDPANVEALRKQLAEDGFLFFPSLVSRALLSQSLKSTRLTLPSYTATRRAHRQRSRGHRRRPRLEWLRLLVHHRAPFCPSLHHLSSHHLTQASRPQRSPTTPHHPRRR